MAKKLKFAAYREKDGMLRTVLADSAGNSIRCVPNGLPRDLDAADAKFYRRNVQAALEQMIADGLLFQLDGKIGSKTRVAAANDSPRKLPGNKA